jgi:hypothetical protein
MSNGNFDWVDDYKSKVQYLKDHFTRLWTRFNYFLTLQSALFGAAILSPEKYHWWIPLFGAFLCVLWYIFGAQDRYLVDLYRKQIEHSVRKIKSEYRLSDYYFIGQTEDILSESEKIEHLNVEKNIYQWRSEYISTTKLAALFPLLILLMWLVIFISLIDSI